MKHLAANPFAMLQRNYSSNLRYACCLVMVFPKDSEAPCNSAGIIPAKYMNRILVLIIKILIYAVLFNNKNLCSCL